VDGSACAIAYVVLDGPLSSARLNDHVRASHGEVAPPDAYLPVAAIPRRWIPHLT
jgi:hypothetical protein